MWGGECGVSVQLPSTATSTYLDSSTLTPTHSNPRKLQPPGTLTPTHYDTHSPQFTHTATPMQHNSHLLQLPYSATVTLHISYTQQPQDIAIPIHCNPTISQLPCIWSDTTQHPSRPSVHRIIIILLLLERT